MNYKGTKPESWFEALNNICDILSQSKIKYFLDQGTLLGVVRDNDFISWDDDIDIGIVIENKLNEKKFQNLFNTLKIEKKFLLNILEVICL